MTNDKIVIVTRPSFAKSDRIKMHPNLGMIIDNRSAAEIAAEQRRLKEREDLVAFQMQINKLLQPKAKHDKTIVKKKQRR